MIIVWTDHPHVALELSLFLDQEIDNDNALFYLLTNSNGVIHS